MLIDKGADVNFKDLSGKPVLMVRGIYVNFQRKKIPVLTPFWWSKLLNLILDLWNQNQSG
jgi:hypothetical protein